MMVVRQVPVDFVLISTELIGIVIGSVLGPMTSKKIPEIWLKRIFVVLAVLCRHRLPHQGLHGPFHLTRDVADNEVWRGRPRPRPAT